SGRTVRNPSSYWTKLLGTKATMIMHPRIEDEDFIAFKIARDRMVDRRNEAVQHRWKVLRKEISWEDVEDEASDVLEFIRDREPLPWVLGPRGRTLSDPELAEIAERKERIGRAVNKLLGVHALTWEELRQGKEPRPYVPPHQQPREPNYPPPDRLRSKAMPRPGAQVQIPPVISQAAPAKQPAVRPAAVTPPKAEPAKAAQPPADPPQPVMLSAPDTAAPPDDQ
ncbi:unnamed protein product, partial [Symbiodinium pilosum]